MNLIPDHLNQNEAQGLRLQETIAQFEIGSMKNFIYLILDWVEKKAALVDPQKDLSGPLAALNAHGFELTQVLLTHSHFDHTAGVEPLLEMYPQLGVSLGELDLHRIPKTISARANFKLLQDGEILEVGSVKLKAIHTPGHSAGEFSFYLEPSSNRVPYLFTGDTIFIRDCGRTDFPDGSNEQMFASIQKIKTLPQDTVLLVGHHYAQECATTIGQELISSPPFQCHSVKELAELP